MMTAIKPDAERMTLVDELAHEAATFASGSRTRRLLHKATDALRSSAGPATREATIEECALLVQTNQETFSETHDGSRRHLTPRKNENLAGLAYADGIRALSLQQEQQPDKGEPVAWEDIAETLCGVDGNGFFDDCSPLKKSAYEIRAKAVSALYANPAPTAEVQDDGIGFRAGMQAAIEIIGNMRQSEAGLFDAAHSGQRGESRSNALYDAYRAIWNELNGRVLKPEQPR